MFEPELPEMPEGDVQELVARLKSLKRVSAPADFAEQLGLRVAADQNETLHQNRIVSETPMAPRRAQLFPYQRTVFSLAAAAVITLILLNLPTYVYRPTPASVSDKVQEYTSVQPALPVPEPMQIKAAPGDQAEKAPASKSLVSKEHGSRDVSSNKNTADMQPRLAQQQFPQELIKSQRGQSTPLVGGSLSTVSRGNGRNQSPDINVGNGMGQGMIMQPMIAAGAPGAPSIGRSAVSPRLADSIRIRDSIRNARKAVRHR